MCIFRELCILAHMAILERRLIRHLFSITRQAWFGAPCANDHMGMHGGLVHVALHNCVHHRPIVKDHDACTRTSVQLAAPRPASALSSASRLSKIEPHSASRLCLSRRLAERLPHMVDAPMDTSRSLPIGPD